MRLSIFGKTFTIEDVPAGLDAANLPRTRWDPRERALHALTTDAPLIQAELARRGVRLADDEVREAVVDALDEDLAEGAAAVASFGDPRALPELSEALDGFEHLDCIVCDYLAVRALADAIEALGGELTDAQRARVDDLRERQRDVWIPGPNYEGAADLLATRGFGPARPPRRERPRLGRNDPCHCGSGRKYKRCHLEADRRDLRGHAPVPQLRS